MNIQLNFRNELLMNRGFRIDGGQNCRYEPRTLTSRVGQRSWQDCAVLHTCHTRSQPLSHYVKFRSELRPAAQSGHPGEFVRRYCMRGNLSTPGTNREAVNREPAWRSSRQRRTETF